MNTQYLRNEQGDREQWLNTLGSWIAEDIIEPHAERLGLPYPPMRFSVGFPPRSSARSKTIGVCVARHASADAHNEIFITPAIDDSAQIAHVLVHEIIHAFLDNEDGHKGRFVVLAKACGLVGKMTATTAGSELEKKLALYIDELGPIPAARIDLQNAKKKQDTRSLKCECSECGFTFRASAMQLRRVTKDSACPSCDRTGTLKHDV